MAQLTVANYLGMLQEDPDNEEALRGLRDAVGNGAQGTTEDPIRLLEMARMAHEQRGELRAAAWLIEVEAPLIQGDPDLEAALFKELGRLRHEELLDDEGARAAYTRALELRPGDSEIQEAIEQVEQAASNWKEIAKRFVEEADDASDATLKTSLLSRAAALIWQYKKKGRDKEVDKLFQRALEADPAATRAARLYGETLRARERWQDLAQVLVESAEHARSRDEKLNLYVRAGRLLAKRLGSAAEAARCYQRALDFAPGHEEALRFLVAHYTEQEQWDALVLLYEDALRSRQKIESEQGILLQIGMVHWRIRNAPDDAEPYFARLRKIDPAHPGMVAFYREHLERSGDSARLLTILGDAQRTTQDPQHKVELAVELARVAQLSEATHDRAIDAWKAVQRLDPGHPEAHTALRELYRKAERWNALVEAMKAEHDAIPPSDAERRLAVLREMVPIYRDRLHLDVMVINTYNAILQLQPDDAEALDALGQTYEAMGRWNDLIQVLGRKADGASDPTVKVDLLSRVASLWIERFANYNQATRPLEAVLELEPENRGALVQLKDIYEKKRAWSSLFDVLKKEAELASDPETRLSNRVHLAKLAGDRLHRHAEAIELWKQVVEEAPQLDGALDALEKLAEREKDWATLALALERRVDLTTDEKEQVKVLQKLGTVYGEHLGDPAGAARTWQRVLEVDPKNGRATRTLRESFLAAGDFAGLERLYAEANDWEGLVEVLGQAAERASDAALKMSLSFRAAEIYEVQIGEPHRAFRNYERVLSVSPQNVRAAAALAPIYEKDEKWARLLGLKEILLGALPPDDREGRLALLGELRALCQERLSDQAGAFAWARAAYSIDPSSEAVMAGLEHAAAEASAFAELAAVYKSRLESTGDPAEKLRLRRRVATVAGEHLGRADEAIAQLQQILDSNPTDAEAIEILDRLYRAEQRTDDLRRLFLHRIEHAQDADEKFLQLGELARLEEDVLGDADSAVSRYEAILEIEPGDTDSLEALDRLHSAADRAAPLADVLRRRREVSTDDRERVEVILRLAELLARRLDDPEGALDAYSDVLTAVPSHEGAVAGLEALEKAVPALAARVGLLLEAAYQARSSHGKLATVLERRLATTTDGAERRELRLRLAEIAANELGDVAGAYAAIEAAFLDAPSDIDLWERLSYAADRAGRHEELAAAYARALEQADDLADSDAADLAGRLARVYDELLGRPEDAEPWHRKVLHHDPLSPPSFAALKELYTTRERWDELQVLYRNRIAQTVDAEQKLELLLQVCFLFEELLDDPGLAIRAHQDVLDLDPDHTASRRALERLYRRTERWRDLVALLRQDQERADGQERLELTFELGQLYEHKLGDAGPAVDQYEQVLLESPTHMRTQEALERLVGEPAQRQRIAAILEPLYDAQGAWGELVRVLEVQLEDVSAPGARVGLLRRVAELRESRLHDLDGAFAAIARAVDADPADGQLREDFARLAQIRGSEPERAAVLERAVTTTDGYLKTELLLELARLWDEQEGDLDRAEHAYTRAIETDADSEATVLPASVALERIHLGRGEHAKLAADLRRQVRFQPDAEARRGLLVRLADLLEEVLGDTDGAIAAHRERIDLDPADADALRSLERLYERREEWQKLVGILQSRENVAVDEDERREIARRIGAIYESQLEDPDNAIVAYNEVLSRFGPDRVTLGALARLYERSARWDDLLEVLQLDLEQAENALERSELRFRAAELMRLRTQDPGRAIEAYAEVLAESPDHREAITALDAMVGGDDREVGLAAARILAPRHEGSADYPRFLAVLGVLAESDDPSERLRSLRRAAEVADVGLEDPGRAFDLMSRALRAGVTEPDVADMLHELERLAAASDRWSGYVAVLGEVVTEIFDGDLQVDTMLRIAQVASTRLEDDALARAQYEKVLRDRPDHADALDALEALCEKDGDHAALRDVLRRKTELATRGPDRVGLLLRQAELCEQRLDDAEGAVDAFEQVLAEEGRTEAFDGLERLYEKLERWDELASIIERRLDAHVGDPVEARFRLGRVCRDRLGDAYRAIDCFKEALAGNAEHQPSISALDRLMGEEEHRGTVAEILEPVYLRRMDWPRVKSVLEARLAAESDVDERKVLLRRLGEMHEDYLEDMEGALETYARLFREDPADTDVWDTLGRLAKHLDRYPRLAEIYDGALRDTTIDGPETARLAFLTGKLYDERTANLERAAELYRRALVFDPTDREAFKALESALIRSSAHRALIDLYREQVDTAPSDAERVSLLLRAAQIQATALEDPDAAIETYREVLGLDPQERTAVEALDRLLQARERWSDLADHLRHRIDNAAGTPDEVGLRHRLGSVLADRLEDVVAAIDVYEEVAQMAPSHDPTILALERLVQSEDHQLRITQILEPIYRGADQWKKLIAILEAQVSLSDDSLESVRLLGEVARLHEDRGKDGGRAFRAWARAFALEPANDEVRAEVDRLAGLLGAWDDHVAAYEQAVAACEDALVVAQLLTTIARVHDERRGDPRSAIETYERLLVHEPGDSSPLDALEALHTMVGDWRGLVDVLGRKTERSLDPAETGELLRRTGSVLEELLGDRQSAIEAYRRASYEDDPDGIALEALDRLHGQAGDSQALADVLGRRIEREPDPGERVALGVRLGALVETQLNQPEQAIEAYARVLDDHPGHPEAVGALARLFERQAMWPDLLDNLRLRAGMAERSDERVALVFRAGEILERELDDVPEALATYQQALELDGRHEPTIEALLRIAHLEDYRAQAAEILEPRLEIQERWDDIATLLEMKAEGAHDSVDKRVHLRRLARVHEEGRRDAAAAFEALSRALAEDPGDEPTAEELVRVAGVLGSWDELADVLASRASSVLDPSTGRQLYVRLARVCEERLGDQARAIEAYGRALEQAGEDDALLGALDRLYVRAEAWPELASVLERRVALALEPAERSELLLRLGALREERFEDRRGAYAAYQEVLDRDPGDILAVQATERLLADEELAPEVLDTLDNVYRQIGATEKVAGLYDVRIRLADSDGERVRLLQEAAALWERELGQPERALAAVRRAFLLDPRDEAMLGDLERLAGAAGSWESLRGVVESVSGSPDVDRELLRDLSLRAATWYRDRLGDLDAAETCLGAAIEADPDAVEAYEARVDILRSAGSRDADLVKALRAWAAVDTDDHARRERLREAARLAEGALGEPQTAAECLEQILQIDGTDAEALDELSRIRAQQERWGDVVELLGRRVDVTMDPGSRMELRKRIAQVCGGPLERRDDAIAAWEGVLDEEPGDLESIEALEQLYEAAERYEDLGRLIERRLDFARTPADQIAARVRLARLSEQRFGRRAEAMEQLREILGIDPTNAEALDEMERLLGLDGRWDEVVEIAERRLAEAVARGDLAAQASGLDRLVSIYQEHLADPGRAADACERKLAIDPADVSTMRTLVEVHEGRGDFASVAAVLERLAGAQGSAEAIGTFRRLAAIGRERLQSPELTERALRAAFELDPTSEESRGLLREHYEAHGRWAELAGVLAWEEEQSADQATKVELLKQIAGIWETRLSDPGQAAASLERAVALVPDDRTVLLPLCDLYIAAGRSGDAVPVLEKIIESYGTRRVKEVAQFHHRLGRALEGMGDLDGALSRYDAAFKIDLTNVQILRDLGRLCHQQGDLDRAQKTFRALLLQKLTPEDGVSKADVYFFLGDICVRQDDPKKAKSMLQRALAEDAGHVQAKALLDTLG